MTELGLDVPGVYIVEGDHTMEGGKAAMEKLIALAELPTAVICSNDMTAIGVLHALDETTLKVPGDISVVGFDDIHLAQFMLPPLTTVQMSCKELATAAVQALRAGVESDHPQSAQKEWPVATRLVVRRSTGFPRGTLLAMGKATVGRRRTPAKTSRKP
jgi:LacI family transcriptional regulator